MQKNQKLLYRKIAVFKRLQQEFTKVLNITTLAGQLPLPKPKLKPKDIFSTDTLVFQEKFSMPLEEGRALLQNVYPAHLFQDFFIQISKCIKVEFSPNDASSITLTASLVPVVFQPPDILAPFLQLAFMKFREYVIVFPDMPALDAYFASIQPHLLFVEEKFVDRYYYSVGDYLLVMKAMFTTVECNVYTL